MPWKQGYTISDEIGLRDDRGALARRQSLLRHRRGGPERRARPAGHHAPPTSTHPDAYFAAHDGLDRLLARAGALRHQGDVRGARRDRARLRAERMRALLADGPRDRRATA